MRKETLEECAQIIEDAGNTIAKMLEDGEQQYQQLQLRYQQDYAKWQALCAEMGAAEETEAPEQQEG